MLAGVKRLVRRALTAVSPETTTAILSARARAHSHRLFREWGLISLNRKVINGLGSTVVAGPFRGLNLTPMTHAEHLSPYLLGSYEDELHPFIEHAVAGAFTQILDVGAKFGYYAVGLARRLPDTPVVAFDPDWWARAATREMACANGTQNVSVEGFCAPRWLDRNLVAGAFILSDCEGYEGELFARSSTPALASATLLIETHDDLVPGVSGMLQRRFSDTHDVTVVKSHSRNVTRRELEFLTPEEAKAAIYEVRGEQEWLVLTPGLR